MGRVPHLFVYSFGFLVVPFPYGNCFITHSEFDNQIFRIPCWTGDLPTIGNQVLARADGSRPEHT